MIYNIFIVLYFYLYKYIMFNQVLYIGPWFDIDYLQIFKDTKTFILIETQPRTQWDSSYNNLVLINQNKNYIDELIQIYKEKNFILSSFYHFMEDYTETTLSDYDRVKYIETKKSKFVDPTLLIFFNPKTGQSVKYYASTNILYNIDNELKNDIYDSDTLYLSGYTPDISLLNYISHYMVNLVCDNDTIYAYDEYENDIISEFILKNNEKDYFKNIYLYKDKFIDCVDIKEVELKRS